jgi:leader peptidase (prepilin peptidase)/N-methyltransferase
LDLAGAVTYVAAFLTGAVFGSFLNMAVWRLPRRKPGVGVARALSEPSRSYCPRCGRSLPFYENIPLLSFLALGAHCRGCRNPIPWRYFWVELLTGGLFLMLYAHFGIRIETAAYCLFFSALIAAFFIDLELYIIPDELNNFALAVGVVLDLVEVARGQHALLWGWLPRSILGAMICAAIFVGIQVLGYGLFHKEAMGTGDVKLARAIGAMMPVGQALVSFLLAVSTGAVIGIAVVGFHALRRPATAQADEAVENDGEPAEEPIPLWERLLYVPFLDLLIELGAWLRIPAAVRLVGPVAEELGDGDDFVAGPTHIPFGPFMVVGAVLAVFVGDPLIHAYLRWVGLQR